MGGTAGWLEVLLFVIGLGCLGLEIFVIPGFGVFGVSGVLLILGSLIMAGHSWTFDAGTNLEGLLWQTAQVLLSLALVGAFAIAMARFLPSMPGFDAMVLGPPSEADEEPHLRLDTFAAGGEAAGDVSVGERGVALTILRPAGKARFDSHVFDVVSEGPFISADTKVEVTSIHGRRIVVREV